MRTDTPRLAPFAQRARVAIRVVLLLTLATGAHSAEGADKPIPSREDRELIMSAVGIGMTEAQRLQFRDEIAEFIQDYRSAMLKISRGHNATDLERRMEKKHDSLLRELDQDMAGMLTREQFLRYDAYRQRLVLKLTRQGPADDEDYHNWEMPPVIHH